MQRRTDTQMRKEIFGYFERPVTCKLTITRDRVEGMEQEKIDHYWHEYLTYGSRWNAILAAQHGDVIEARTASGRTVWYETLTITLPRGRKQEDEWDDLQRARRRLSCT